MKGNKYINRCIVSLLILLVADIQLLMADDVLVNIDLMQAQADIESEERALSVAYDDFRFRISENSAEAVPTINGNGSMVVNAGNLISFFLKPEGNLKSVDLMVTVDGHDDKFSWQSTNNEMQMLDAPLSSVVIVNMKRMVIRKISATYEGVLANAELTDIKDIDSPPSTEEASKQREGIYTLDGQRLYVQKSELKQGLYIINGIKTIVK